MIQTQQQTKCERCGTTPCIAKNLCVRCYGRVKYQNNPQLHRQLKRNWVAKNKQKTKESKHKSNLKRYGLTVEDYNILLAKQNNSCAVCLSKTSKRPSSRLVVDHDHKTNKVRGILCSNCNVALGLLEDSLELINNLHRYLNDSKSN